MNEAFDDQQAIGYLIGALPEQEADRLDRLSVEDDEFAARLTAVENDLVDAYVRGELSEETRARFRSHYLASPMRREKLRVAELLVAVADRPVASGTSVAVRDSPRPWHWGLNWAAAALTLAAMLACGYLLRENARLRSEAQRQIAKTSPKPAIAGQPAIVLFPQTRGAGSLLTIGLPADTHQLALELELEGDDFPAYRASLKSLAASQDTQQVDNLAAHSRGAQKFILVEFPTALLSDGRYSIDLTGVAANGQAEFVAAYIFSVAKQ